MNNKYDNDRFKKAVELLTRVIIDKTADIPFVLKKKTTNNYKEFVSQGLPLHISEEGCNNTIYGNSHINRLFRVWHDIIHLSLNLSFSKEDELEVCRIQKLGIVEYSSISYSKEEVNDACLLLHIEIIDQYNYYEENNCYVENQLDFVYNRFMDAIKNSEIPF